MDPFVIVHVVTAVLLLALTLVVGVWGLARTRQIIDGAAHPREGRVFAQLLQLSHTLVLAVGLLGLVLLGGDHRPGDPLHTRVYGVFMVVAIVASYGYRTPDAAKNVRVFAIASLCIFALGLRAVSTGA
ncbi:MAG: hypothetical protein H7287_13165 [Thermoleophilia bacterium]|nr:hypothetical protein [Thermoleophilia bacterium]